MVQYRILLNRVIDGDSMDIDIILGFGIVLQNKRLRLIGVDTPESRTSDDEEKKFGLKAKEFVVNWCQAGELMLKINDRDGEQDKFGRILGDLINENGDSLVKDIISNYHGVAYEGQNKEEIKKAHLANRIKLHTI